MSWIAGADGCRAEWCVVLLDLATAETRVRIVPSIEALFHMPEQPLIIAIDIPIGLPEFTMPGGRDCERKARKVLGRKASSVFSALGRAPLRSSSRLEAHTTNQEGGGVGVGAQAWGLSAKLREADLAVTSERQRVMREVHPEVSFWAMNGRRPIMPSKKTAIGARERIAALVAGGMAEKLTVAPPQGLRAKLDDYLDACAATWTAARIARSEANRFPEQPAFDARRLDMAIWY